MSKFQFEHTSFRENWVQTANFSVSNNSVASPVQTQRCVAEVFLANLLNRYSALCWRPVTHAHFAQTWASYSAIQVWRYRCDFRCQDTSDPRHFGANLLNRYSALCWRPVTHAQTWASYSALYRFGRLSHFGTSAEVSVRHFGTSAELSGHFGTIVPKCPKDTSALWKTLRHCAIYTGWQKGGWLWLG